MQINSVSLKWKKKRERMGGNEKHSISFKHLSKSNLIIYKSAVNDELWEQSQTLKKKQNHPQLSFPF